MRVAIFGTGGAGGYFGAQLARAGHDVVFIARGRHLEAIRANGLRLETPGGDEFVRAAATDDPGSVGLVDAVIVGVKAWQTKEAGEAIRAMVAPHTLVAPLQNGVEAASELSAALGPQNVIGGLCGTLSFVAGPGHIRSIGSQNFIKFGELDNQPSARVENLRRAFAEAGVAVEIPPDIEKALWEKFLMVTTFGGVGAITRAPVGVTRALPQTRKLMEQGLQETFAVAQARGVALDETAPARTMKFYDALPPNGTTSLHRDIVDGKPSELDYWSGAVVRLGREAGVATPLHQFIYECLLPAEQRARGEFVWPA